VRVDERAGDAEHLRELLGSEEGLGIGAVNPRGVSRPGPFGVGDRFQTVVQERNAVVIAWISPRANASAETA
jgi:hypothetical protein